MRNGHVNDKSLRDVADQCEERSPESAHFRELLEMACKHAAAGAGSADQSTDAGKAGRTGAKPCVHGEVSAPADEAHRICTPVPSHPAPSHPTPAAQSPMSVGEVIETHHPLRPGRVLVRWQDHERQIVTGWLLPERHLSLRAGDRVLLALPCGWREWIVTGALGRDPEAMPQPAPDHERQVHLEPGEAVRLVAHDGQPLLTVRQSSDGPVVELGADNVELKVPRTLRFSAQVVEINASGSIDLRSDGDTVVRGRTIRLN